LPVAKILQMVIPLRKNMQLSQYNCSTAKNYTVPKVKCWRWFKEYRMYFSVHERVNYNNFANFLLFVHVNEKINSISLWTSATL
jgi:hypothetical protein